MDFSAWFEVYLGGRWYTFDARHNIPRIGRILMARGRDAADVAISTTFGPPRSPHSRSHRRDHRRGRRCLGGKHRHKARHAESIEVDHVVSHFVRPDLETDQRIGPEGWVIGTSAASRPWAISTRPIRGMLLRGSNVYHCPPR